MIDPASDLAAIFASGGDFTPLAGTLTQGGVDYPFSTGSSVRRELREDGGEKDREEHSVFLLAEDLGVAPQRDLTVVFTGESGESPWLADRVSPVQGPDGEALGYELDLARWTPRVGR